MFLKEIVHGKLVFLLVPVIFRKTKHVKFIKGGG